MGLIAADESNSVVLYSEGAMFFRFKKSGQRTYIQIVENKRVDGAVRQSVIANLGRADELAASGALASLLATGAKLKLHEQTHQDTCCHLWGQAEVPCLVQYDSRPDVARLPVDEPVLRDEPLLEALDINGIIKVANMLPLRFMAILDTREITQGKFTIRMQFHDARQPSSLMIDEAGKPGDAFNIPAIICALELLLYPFSVAFDARGRGSLLLPAWPGVDICRYRESSPMPASAVTLPCVKLPLDARMSAWG